MKKSMAGSVGRSTAFVAMLALLIVAMADATKICKVDTSELAECLPAVTGKSPPLPTKQCCKVVHRVDLHCLCQYKSALPAMGIDPDYAMALPKKCGLKSRPKCNDP